MTKSTKNTKKSDSAPAIPDPAHVKIDCAFTPQDDITTLELAILLHFIIRNKPLTLQDWNKLEEKSPRITRHLTTFVKQQENAAKV